MNAALRSPRFPWRRSAIAALAWAAAGGLLGTAALALCSVGECVTPAVDARALADMHGLRTPWLTAFFAAITWLGSMWVLLPAALALCIWQYHKGNNALFLLTPLALAGAWLLAHLAKLAVARPRPDLHQALITLPADTSFPSAHTLQITACTLAAILATRLHRQWLTVTLALLLIAAVALSRLYLQVHFPSDVLFGLMAAAVWTGGLYYAMARTR